MKRPEAKRKNTSMPMELFGKLTHRTITSQMKVIAHRHAIPFRYQNKKLVDYVLEGYGPWSVSMSEGDVRDLSKEDDHDSDMNAVKIYYTPGFTPGTLTTIVPNVLASGGRQRSGLIFSGNIIPVEDEYGIENVSDAPKIEEQVSATLKFVSSSLCI